jgi:hypothetical protein
MSLNDQLDKMCVCHTCDQYSLFILKYALFGSNTAPLADKHSKVVDCN